MNNTLVFLIGQAAGAAFVDFFALLIILYIFKSFVKRRGLSYNVQIFKHSAIGAIVLGLLGSLILGVASVGKLIVVAFIVVVSFWLSTLFK